MTLHPNIATLAYALSITLISAPLPSSGFVFNHGNNLPMCGNIVANSVVLVSAATTDSGISSDERLVQWLDEKGCSVSNVRIDTNDIGIRGLLANRDINQGEIIVNVPYPAALSVGNTLIDGDDGVDMIDSMSVATSGSSGDSGFDMSKFNADDVYDVYQALRFLKEIVPSSDLAPYVNSLPDKPASGDEAGVTPDFWSEDVIMEIEIPSFVNEVLERKRIVKEVAAKVNIDEDDLRWATWMIRSRRFSTEDTVVVKSSLEDDQLSFFDMFGKKKTIVQGFLLPFMDMANHDSDPNASIGIKLDRWARNFDESSSFVLRAERKIKKNEEITISYLDGDATSLDLLGKYGFFVGRNPVDKQINWEEMKPLFSTTLEEDENELASFDNSTVYNGSRGAMLSLRILLKRLMRQ